MSRKIGRRICTKPASNIGGPPQAAYIYLINLSYYYSMIHECQAPTPDVEEIAIAIWQRQYDALPEGTLSRKIKWRD